MSTGTLLVGSVLVAMCLLPYLYLILKGNSSSKKHWRAFQSFVRHHSLTIESSDTWKNKIIGIDLKKNQLLFMSSAHERNEFVLFRLDEFIDCELVETFSEASTPQKKSLQKIRLTLLRPKGNKGVEALDFFDSEQDMTLENEKSLAAKWVSIVQHQLKRA